LRRSRSRVAACARFEIDAEQVDAPVGTLVFVPAGVKRTAFAEEPATTIVAIGGTPGRVYEPNGFEIWGPWTGQPSVDLIITGGLSCPSMS
jgi:hypothetical protein